MFGFDILRIAVCMNILTETSKNTLMATKLIFLTMFTIPIPKYTLIQIKFEKINSY